MSLKSLDRSERYCITFPSGLNACLTCSSKLVLNYLQIVVIYSKYLLTSVTKKDDFPLTQIHLVARHTEHMTTFSGYVKEVASRIFSRHV